MIGFIFRCAFISLIGILLDPNQLAHRLPTPQQITHFEHTIEQNHGLRHVLALKWIGLQKNLTQVQATIKAADVAYLDIRKELDKDAKVVGKPSSRHNSDE